MTMMGAAPAGGQGLPAIFLPAAATGSAALGAAGCSGQCAVAVATGPDPPLALAVDQASASPSLAFLSASTPTAESLDELGWGVERASVLDEELKASLLGNTDLLEALFEDEEG